MIIQPNEVPQVGSLAKDLMHAAMCAPRMNKGGKTQAVRLLTDAEKIAVRREYAQGFTLRGLATKYKVSEVQIRNCIG